MLKKKIFFKKFLGLGLDFRLGLNSSVTMDNFGGSLAKQPKKITIFFHFKLHRSQEFSRYKSAN